VPIFRLVCMIVLGLFEFEEHNLMVKFDFLFPSILSLTEV
jgi:hypothetical protein